MTKEELQVAIEFSITLFKGVIEKAEYKERFPINTYYYFRVRKDFIEVANKIPMFAGRDALTGMIYISESVPKEFRDVWFAHEYRCTDPICPRSCADITLSEIEYFQKNNHTQLPTFLQLRISMYIALEKHFPTHPQIEGMKASLKILRKAQTSPYR